MNSMSRWNKELDLLNEFTREHKLRRYGLSLYDIRPFVSSDAMLLDLVVRFLELTTEPAKTWDKKFHSYRMKHDMECYINIYVPNGVLIAGCYTMGYEVKKCYQKDDYPNAEFKMRYKKEYRRLFENRVKWSTYELTDCFSNDIDQRSVDLYHKAIARIDRQIPYEIVNNFPANKVIQRLYNQKDGEIWKS